MNGNVTSRDYERAFDKGTFADVEEAFAALPYRVTSQPEAFGVIIEIKNDMLDRVVSLFGEGTKGPWRAGIRGRVLAYGWDEYVRVRPGLADEELRILKELDIILDKTYIPPPDLK